MYCRPPDETARLNLEDTQLLPLSPQQSSNLPVHISYIRRLHPAVYSRRLFLSGTISDLPTRLPTTYLGYQQPPIPSRPLIRQDLQLDIASFSYCSTVSSISSTFNIPDSLAFLALRAASIVAGLGVAALSALRSGSQHEPDRNRQAYRLGNSEDNGDSDGAMSSAFSQPGQSLAPCEGQDIIFCHNCGYEWYRTIRDTSPPPPCQRCEDEFVEIVSRENDPRAFQQTVVPLFADALLGLGNNDDTTHDTHMHQHSHDRGIHDDPDFDDLDEFDHDHLHDHIHNFHSHLHSHAHTHAHGGHDDSGHDRDHDYRNDVADSDPDEADIEEQEFYGPNNLIMYRTISTYQPGGQPRGASGNNQQQSQPPPPRANEQQRQSRPGATRRPGVTDPTEAESMINTFTQFFNGFRNANAGRSGPETLFFSNNGQPGAFGSAQRTATPNTNSFGATSFTIATGPVRPRGSDGTGTEDFNTVFGNIMGNIGFPNLEDQYQQAAPGLPPGVPAALHHILIALLSRGSSVQHGDAVHSDEALDRIISMLMETAQTSSGAPPASQAALDELERKKVDENMLGPERHAECTICITEVQLNDEVVALPCKHWFHEECVVMWLRQHNTCPVCRNPVVSSNVDNASGPSENLSSTAAAAATGNNAGNGSNNNTTTPNNPSNPSGSMPRSFVSVNIGRPGNNGIPGIFMGVNTPHSGSGSTADIPRSNSGDSSPTTAPTTNAAPSRGSSSSASPMLNATNARYRMNQDRLNAIRSTAGLPPAATTNNINHYRSSRVPERSAAAERERRRRDSHSPNPGHNVPSRRYNIPIGYEDLISPSEDFPASTTSRDRQRSPSSSSHYHWWSSMGSGGDGGDGSSGSQSSHSRDRSSRDRSRTTEPRREPYPSSGSGFVHTPSLSRTSTQQGRSSPYSDPTPDAAAVGRSFPTSWLPSPYPTRFGSDAQAGPHAADEANGAGHNHDNNNGNSGESGSSGISGSGIFSFLRGLGNGHQANPRRRP